MIKAGALFLAFAVLSLGYARAETMEVARIQVSREGTVTIDGKPSTIVALNAVLARLKEKDGVVWFYREKPELEPTSQQSEIFAILMSARIPISLSTKPDFSDAIGEDGKPHPRKFPN
jgi:hypothetical protein